MSGNASRLQAMAQIASYKLPDPINYREEPSGELFGTNVFGLSEMKKRLSKTVFKSVEKTIKDGAPFDPEVADAVASAMKTWAMEKVRLTMDIFSIH